MSHKRTRAAEIARHTLDVLAAGQYQNRRGETVRLRERVEAAQRDTLTYPPDEPLPVFAPSGVATAFETVDDTTLEAARKLAADGFRPVALNFASARNPGGGFLNGANAQEESLCRASALYPCINGNPMYQHHAGTGGGFYTNYAIYSPGVPVIKDDDGELLDDPYMCAFVTAPAVNCGAIRDSERRLVRDEMRARIEKVLALMAGHGHDAAVLGAWGCGVFRNDPELIAALFAAALRGPFAGRFARVVFAVLDPSPEGHVIGPFAERFGG